MFFRAAILPFVLGQIASLMAAGLPPYVITTIAGSTNVGDGGPATQAYFGILEGVACGSDGSIYLADADDHRVRRVTPDGRINTIAGNGKPGYAGDGGPARSATLNAPYGLALNAAGDLFIADLGNNAVRRISASGVISTVASWPHSADASPRNVTIGPDNLLYISEFAGQKIDRLNPDGTLTVIAGTGTAGFGGDGGSAVTSQLNYPAGIAFDKSGNLYIADSGNARVREVSGERMSTVAGAGGIGNAAKLPLRSPTAITLDAAGNLYIANVGSPGVVEVTPRQDLAFLPGAARDFCFTAAADLYMVAAQHVQVAHADGTFETLYGSASHDYGNGGPATKARLGAPSGIAVQPDGTLVVADSALNRLRSISGTGQISSSPAGVSAPQGLAVDTAGDLLVADTGFHLVQSISPTGNFRTIAGSGKAGWSGDGGPATDAQVDAPTAVTSDNLGNTYFTDGDRVRVILPSGMIQTIAGTGHAGFNGDGPDGKAVQLSHPGGLAADNAGNLYISDTGNNLLRRRKPDGAIETVGNPNGGVAVNGVSLANATFSAPMGMIFDAAGNLWIADAGNSCIRVVTPAGIVYNVAGTGNAGFSGDGGLATSALLSSPTAVAVTPDGFVYIADTSNHRVRLLTPNGTPAPVVPDDPAPDPTPVVVTTPARDPSIAVVNAANVLPGAVAPGSLITIFGEAFGPDAPAIAGTSVGTKLAGVEVLIDNVPAPLLYVSATQINAQVPYEAAGKQFARVDVRYNGAVVSSSTVAISPFAPAFFEGPMSAVAAIDQDGAVNGAANFAPRGSIVSLYATGDGAESNGAATGKVATAPYPLTSGKVVVTIGDSPAEVLYAGAAPGLLGVMQINVRVPSVAAGTLGVTLTVGGVSSPPGPQLQVWP